MKCFFHEALCFWEYAAPLCIIDNTNLARLRGTGANALINPEMEVFAKQYGIEFRCHALGHPNRKAGEERSFWTVETNFLPGRLFKNMEEFNQQAFEWAIERMDNRPQSKTGMIPARTFEEERSFLTPLSRHLPAPYKVHKRGTDQCGYIALAGNYYWVPGTRRDEVTVLEYAHRLKIYLNRECLAEYSLPAEGMSNPKFSPEGLPKPPHSPSNRKYPTQEEHLGKGLGCPAR